jgi:hypothetical protein
VLLLGGSSAGGYLRMGELPMLDTNSLVWSRLRCPGTPPAARAGHVAAVLRSGGGAGAGGSGGAFRVLVFGGGNSAAGFADVHELDVSSDQLAGASTGGPAAGSFDFAEAAASNNGSGSGAWGWRRLESRAAAGEAPHPQPAEGAACAMSGGLVLVLGGYSAAGATKASWAWPMVPAPRAARDFGAEACTTLRDADLDDLIRMLERERGLRSKPRPTP